MKLNEVVTENVFNEAFKATMDVLNVKGKDLAELTGRSYNNISRIRQGKDNPNLRDFCTLLNAAESLAPGFYAIFLRKLVGESLVVTEEVQPSGDVLNHISQLSVQSRKKLVMDIVESLVQERQPEPVAS